jgi:hypothetical protein
MMMMSLFLLQSNKPLSIYPRLSTTLFYIPHLLLLIVTPLESKKPLNGWVLTQIMFSPRLRKIHARHIHTLMPVTIAQVCHYVMLHCAELISIGNPNNKKQYGLKAGLRKFSERGNDALMKELCQFHILNCFKSTDPCTLSHTDCRNALASLMFITEKRTGEVKAQGCADSCKQWEHIAKEEATAPTVTSKAIFTQGIIFAHEHRDVATCDIPGAFLQADNPDYILMRLDGIVAELMVTIAPNIYQKYVTTNPKGKLVLYVQLKKALYGMMKSALLFYCKLVADLHSIGFIIIPYNPCVANKMIDGHQLTICWHVDDLFIAHKDP